MCTLDELGKNLKLPQSSDHNNYLNSYEKEINLRWEGKCNILIISNSNLDKISSILSERFPESNIVAVSYNKAITLTSSKSKGNIDIFNFNSLDELVQWSINIGSIDVIIEHCSNYKSHKLALFKELFYYLSHNGIYFIEELHAKFIPQLNDCDGDDIIDLLHLINNINISPANERSKLDGNLVSLSNHIESVTIKRKLAIVEKTGLTYRGLRTLQSFPLIETGSLKGQEILKSNIPDIFSSTSISNGNIKKLLSRHPSTFKIPPSYINLYFNAYCSPGQLVTQGNYLLPDAFRMQHHLNLSNKNATNLSKNFYSLNVVNESKFLKGDYLYLDSEYPGHFGHFTSEVISRLWAWKKLRHSIPNLKVLLSVHKGKDLPAYAKVILNSFGISDKDIITFDSRIQVENLYTASPFYVIGSHIHPEINEVWDDIRNGVTGGESKITGDKLFIARPIKGGRKCLNPELLESMFKDFGFEFFNPENYSWEDQLKTFCQAKYIAGYSGSGLFNTMFCNKTKNLISIGSDSYTAINEHFFCSVKKINLDYIWGDSLIKHGSKWSPQAFMSDYNFNYERDQPYLQSILEKMR